MPICLSIERQSFLNLSMPSRKSRCSSSVQRPCKLPSLQLCFFYEEVLESGLRAGVCPEPLPKKLVVAMIGPLAV